jgi:putative membrane protein
MSPAERTAVAILGAAAVGFGIYGYATGAKSTTGYLFSVALVGALVWRVRRAPLPDLLVIALAVDAAAHLAGGLVAVGDDVLYNASIGPQLSALHTHLVQYDHFVHAFGAFLATLTLWTLLAPPTADDADRRHVMVLCVLGGLGIGALNEVIEFIATTAHSAAHIGGYNNTGWDLVSNTIGAFAAIPLMHRVPRGATGAP